MTTWSGFTNHLQIGYDVWTDGYDSYTPSINVYVQIHIRVDSSWSFNDAQTVNLSGAAGGSWNFQNTLGKNGQWDSPVAVIGGQGQNYGGGPNYNFHAQLDGNYLGAGPAIDFSFWLPPRPVRVPSPPGGPSFHEITGNAVNVTWGYPADDGGSGADYSWFQLGLTNFGTLVYDNQTSGWSGRSISGLMPNTTYFGREAAHNAAGWSGWSGVGAFTTDPYGVPTPSVTAPTPTTLAVSWGAPGVSPTPVWAHIQVATDAAFNNVVQQVGQEGAGPLLAWTTSRTFTGLTPGTTYYVRVRASPGNNWGVWSAAGSAKTMSGAKVRVGGVWKDGVAYVRVGGAWKQALVYKRVNGAWKQ